MAKKPGSGQTAMCHAGAVVSAIFPGHPVLTAQKSVVWIPDGRGGRRPISHREDLFGCFDICVLTALAPVLIQVTTEQKRGQSVTARKRKIERTFLTHYPDGFGDVWIWSWVARTHFRWWQYRFQVSATDDDFGWVEQEPILSPRLKTVDGRRRTDADIYQKE